MDGFFLAAIFLAMIAKDASVGLKKFDNVEVGTLKQVNGVTVPASLLPRTRFKERIVKGEEATPHAFPYQAYLVMPLKIVKINDTFLTESSLCGGSLISPISVLTAAHCVDKATVALVYLGVHNKKEIENNETHVVTSVSRHFIIHPDWTPELFYNDLAIVKLQEPVKLNKFIAVISLPTKYNSFIGQIATATGWGQTGDYKDETDELRYYSNKVIRHSQCSPSYSNLVALFHICISGEGGKSACMGDSGGPLTTIFDGKLIQIGIVSFSRDCESGYPPVFTRVTYYLDWIKANTGVTINNIVIRPRLFVIFILWIFLF